MTIENVYLSIVNDSASYNRLNSRIGARKTNREALPYRYSLPVLRELAKLAAVYQDCGILTEESRVEVWRLIVDHMYDVDLDTHPDYNPKQTKKEENMTITVETKHFVGNQDVSTMTGADLIEVIKKLEKEIADLKAVNSESKYIEGKVKELQTTLKAVVAHLDSKL